MGLSQSQRRVMMTGMSVCRDMGVEFCGSSFSYRPRVLSSNLGVGEFGGEGDDRDKAGGWVSDALTDLGMSSNSKFKI
jgi:hypothetical protein